MVRPTRPAIHRPRGPAVAGVAFVVAATTGTYTAKSLVRVSPDDVLQRLIAPEDPPPTVDDNYAAGQVAIFRSDPVVAGTARVTGLTRRQILNRVSVDANTPNRLVTVSARGPEKADAVRLANAAARQYLVFRHDQPDRRRAPRGGCPLGRQASALLQRMRRAPADGSAGPDEPGLRQSLPERYADIFNRRQQLLAIAGLDPTDSALVQRARVEDATTTGPVPHRAPRRVPRQLHRARGRDRSSTAQADGSERTPPGRAHRSRHPRRAARCARAPGRVPGRPRARPPLQRGDPGAVDDARLRLGAAPRVIVVTSPEDPAASALTAANLAVVSAQGDNRTIIVSTDPQRPVPDLAGPAPATGIGFADLLEPHAGDYELHGLIDAALRASHIPGLFVLEAGAPTRKRLFTLRPDRLRQVLAALLETAAVVIVDAPSVVGSSDAMVLAEAAEVAVLVVGLGAGSESDAVGAAHALATARAPVTGLVMTGTTSRAILQPTRQHYEEPRRRPRTPYGPDRRHAAEQDGEGDDEVRGRQGVVGHREPRERRGEREEVGADGPWRGTDDEDQRPTDPREDQERPDVPAFEVHPQVLVVLSREAGLLDVGDRA